MKEVKSVYKTLSDGGGYFFFIGKQYVVGITYHEPNGKGDAHYCDVEFEGGSITRIFNPDSIEFRYVDKTEKE